MLFDELGMDLDRELSDVASRAGMVSQIQTHVQQIASFLHVRNQLDGVIGQPGKQFGRRFPESAHHPLEAFAFLFFPDVFQVILLGFVVDAARNVLLSVPPGLPGREVDGIPRGLMQGRGFDERHSPAVEAMKIAPGQAFAEPDIEGEERGLPHEGG